MAALELEESLFDDGLDPDFAELAADFAELLFLELADFCDVLDTGRDRLDVADDALEATGVWTTSSLSSWSFASSSSFASSPAGKFIDCDSSACTVTSASWSFSF